MMMLRVMMIVMKTSLVIVNQSRHFNTIQSPFHIIDCSIKLVFTGLLKVGVKRFVLVTEERVTGKVLFSGQ